MPGGQADDPGMHPVPGRPWGGWGPAVGGGTPTTLEAQNTGPLSESVEQAWDRVSPPAAPPGS